MAVKTFRSKVDWWIALLLIATLFIVLTALGSYVLQAANSIEALLAAGVTMLVLVFLVWMTLGTYYRVDGKKLKIVAGPVRWTIPVDEITSIEETRSPLSSPALSLDRLRIRYAEGRSVMISPKDKKQFVKALGLTITG